MNSLEIIKNIIVELEDDLQHYTMVDIDKVKAKYIELEIEDYKQVLQDLECLEQLQNDIKLNETQIDDLTLEVANYKHALEEKNEIIMDLKEDLRLTTIERTNCEDIWEEEHQKCCKLEKENKELKEKVIDISNKEQLMTAYYKDYKEAIKIMIRVNINPKIFSCALISHKIIFGSDMTYKEICADYNLTKEEFYLLKEVFSNE